MRSLHRSIVPLGALLLVCTSCYVRTRPAGPREHREAPPPREHREAPPATTSGTQGAVSTPDLTFRLSGTHARPGQDIRLYLSQPVAVEVYYNGKIMPKRVEDDGSTLVVTIPGDAQSGYFELEWQGRRYRAAMPLNVVP